MALELARIFQNHMMLQANKPVKIWGKSEKDTIVSAEIQGRKAKTKTMTDGSFMLELDPLEYSKEEKMTISTSTESITVSDVAVGEIWLAGGQSNMEFFMHYEMHFKEELENCENPDIRFFDVPEVTFDGQEQSFDYSEFSIWRKLNKRNLEWFSGVGYFFAKKLYASLNVPIGIVGCNYGGTSTAAWMKKESVDEIGRLWIQDYNKKLDEIRSSGLTEDEFWSLHKKSQGSDKGHPFENSFNNFVLYKTPPLDECMNFFQQQAVEGSMDLRLMTLAPEAIPGILHEHMLKTLAPFSLKGIIFYQGESDEAHADIYGIMLTKLIEDWRELFQDKLPFIEVQLPGFESWLGAKETAWATIRKNQKLVSDTVRDVYMASISDAGEALDIHPKNKKIPGDRLAMVALDKIYKLSIKSDAPTVSDVRRENKKITITFANGDGLHLVGSEINGLKLFPDIQYEAEFDKNKLILELNEEPEKLIMKYGINGYYKINIYNKWEIPAIPFECMC